MCHKNYFYKIIYILVSLHVVKSNRSFTVDYENNCFLKDGKPFRYVSGSMHYFRVPPALWEDRMMKMKAAGLNALQTYIEWSRHEPEPDTYIFEDDYDLISYIQTAAKVGLLVILRPGPFIDAEREMGGLPYWLLKVNPDMKLRTSDKDYLFYVDRWFDILFPKLKPLLYVNGGPIIALQVENEYGSYSACDFKYTTHLRNLYLKHFDQNVVLFTTDGSSSSDLVCGKINGVFATIDFGSGVNVSDAFHNLRLHQSKGPLVNSEYYPGWLDHWSEPHANVNSESVCDTLDQILAMNASVNIYMFHGGTSFGFYNGANMGTVYQPCPTSYDYDAPLSEAGDPTPKYFAMRKVIGKYLPLPSVPVPSPSPKMDLGSFTMNIYSTLWNYLKLNKFYISKYPLSFEEMNHGYGFAVYTTTVTFRTTDPVVLNVPGLRDRGYVYINNTLQGILSRSENIYSLPIMIKPNQNITILVENQGRICFGNDINDRKGIIQNVTLGSSVILTDWTIYPLSFKSKDVMNYLRSSSINSDQCNNCVPGFYMSLFKIPDSSGYPYDTFLKLNGWHKGIAFLNEYNLGRYWPIVGPQVTLYAPSTYFQSNNEWNSIALFELEYAPCDDSSSCTISFVKDPILNGTTPN